ncbi:MAG: transcription repressor NadR [Lachnospiraceae bacterium]|nr:transcription repressor NadR [Lachnospiraceae bacterium]
MNADERRERILQELIKASGGPVSASSLAGMFNVSRQIIVGDVALLRASGENISATPRGYVMQSSPDGQVRQIACRHGEADMQKELNAIVDQGCTVLDVIVEHPVYGQLTGPLHLRSRYDVAQFLERCRKSDAHPLSDLTSGVHLHTIVCPDEEAFSRVRDSLDRLGILFSM